MPHVDLSIFEAYLNTEPTTNQPLAFEYDPREFLSTLTKTLEENQASVLRIVIENKESKKSFFKMLDGRIIDLETGKIVTPEDLLLSL